MPSAGGALSLLAVLFAAAFSLLSVPGAQALPADPGGPAARALPVRPVSGQPTAPNASIPSSPSPPNDRPDCGEAGCRPPTLDQAIANTKMAAALAYADELAGRSSRDRVEGVEQWVRALTGEPAREVIPSSPGVLVAGRSGQSAAAAPRRSVLQEKFVPFQQVTPFYCGPATAMSILNILGPRTSRTTNADSGVRETLTGDPVHDQQLLAADFWLAADANSGTNWGDGYMPFTLNSWRGTKWYVASGTPNVEGTLTKEQALAAIKYDTDRGYPVAENVLYDTSTYYPAGFLPGVTYQHWDTVYGHYQQQGREVVQVGQVYHDNTLPASPYQDVDWDVHWTAIEQWHGIVW